MRCGGFEIVTLGFGPKKLTKGCQSCIVACLKQTQQTINKKPARGMNFDFSARANHIMKLRLRALFSNIKIGVAAVVSIACVGLKF